MTKVLVGGVFDHFHMGHAYFLEQAKKKGAELIVIVANDEEAKRKGAHENQKKRADTIKNTHLANEVIIGNKELDYVKTIKKIKPDIIALGYDQKLPLNRAELKKLNVKVRKIKRLESYSSSKVRTELEKQKIIIIGTSHISPQSIAHIKRALETEKPDCVAVELDPGRLEALRRGETVSISAIRHIGFTNYVVAKIMSMLQQYLGKKIGVIPGTEMLTAVQEGMRVGADVMLIDQDIRITLNRLRSIPLSEKIKIVLSLFKKMEIKEFDLEKVPIDVVVDALLDRIQEVSPNLYRVMIGERDRHMARALADLSRRYGKIIAVVGLGHRNGILEELKKLKSKHN